jgi:K(+)-stimulated pyrophosphate-energized sodium pump
VVRIAESGETGTATVMITGLAVGMESVIVPLLTICADHLRLEVSSPASTASASPRSACSPPSASPWPSTPTVRWRTTPAASPRWPGSAPETREITDSLDELGNTTAAIGKGFAIGAAALAALAIITAYVETVRCTWTTSPSELGDPDWCSSACSSAACCPFLIASITMTAVGDAAFEMIKEIRRQFREIPGLLEGTAEPDNGALRGHRHHAALKKMILPGVSPSRSGGGRLGHRSRGPRRHARRRAARPVCCWR